MDYKTPKTKLPITAITLLLLVSIVLASCQRIPKTGDAPKADIETPNISTNYVDFSTNSLVENTPASNNEDQNIVETTSTTSTLLETTIEEKQTSTSVEKTTTTTQEETTTTTTENPQTIPGIHVVQIGDYPGLIADLYNITLDQLYEMNQSSLDSIYVNQKLIVDPALAPTTTTSTTVAPTTSTSTAETSTTLAENQVQKATTFVTTTTTDKQPTSLANTSTTEATTIETTTAETTVAPTQAVINRSKPTFNALLGFSKTAFVGELQAHQYDNFYLGTPYSDLTNLSRFWEYPNIMTPGKTMNCGGFIGYVIQQAGGDINRITPNSPYMGGHKLNIENWHRFITVDGRAQVVAFNSVSELLSSGLAEKGDIIYSYPKVWREGIDAHIGIFWGNTPYENVYWHSDFSGNRRSHIVIHTPADNVTVYLVKIS